MAFSLNLGTLSVSIGANTDKLKKAQKEVDRTAKKMGSSFGRLKGIIAGVLSVELVRRTLTLADSMTLLDAKVKSVARSAEEFQKVRQGIRDIARETGSSIQNVSTMAQRMLIAGDNLGVTTEQILSATDAFNKLGIIGGATFDQMKFAQLQFGQAMSSNFTRAEEFNSLLENTPLIAKEIAIGMGLTVGALQRGVKEGKILSKDVFAGLLQRTNSIAKKWEEFPLTLSRATGMLTNSIAEAVQKINEEIGATESLAEALADVAGAIDDLVSDDERLNEVIETTKAIFEALAFILIAKVGIGFGSVVASMKKTAGASLLLDLALNRNLTTSVKVNGVLKVMPVRLKFAARSMLFLKTAASGLLRIFGGLPGLIFTVVSAFLLFRDSQSEAEKQIEKTNDKIADQIKNLKNLSNTEFRIQAKEANQALFEAVEKMKDLNEQKKVLDRAFEASKGQGLQNLVDFKALEKVKSEFVLVSAEARKLKELVSKISTIKLENMFPDQSLDPAPASEGFDSKDIDSALEKARNSLEELNQEESTIMQIRLDRFLDDQIIKLTSVKNLSDKEKEIAQEKFDALRKIQEKAIKVQEKADKDAATRKVERLSRQSEIEKDNRSRDQQAIVSDLGAVLGKEKEAAIVSAGISLQRAIAKAMEKGAFGLAEVAGITGTFASLISSIRSAKAPGRAFGGTVSSGQATPINERGSPEMFVNNAGRQFLLPNEGGKVVPLSGGGGGGGSMSVTIVNNSNAEVGEPVVTEGRLMIEINNAVERAVTQVNSSLSTGRGESADALRNGFTQTRNI